MAHHIIYVPGLGDYKTYGQNIAIQIWRLFGFRPHYFPLFWQDVAGFKHKLDRLEKFIAGLQKSGDIVSLVGTSAGASAVLNAYVNNMQVAGVVYICGKINHPENVSPLVFEKILISKNRLSYCS